MDRHTNVLSATPRGSMYAIRNADMTRKQKSISQSKEKSMLSYAKHYQGKEKDTQNSLLNGARTNKGQL